MPSTVVTQVQWADSKASIRGVAGVSGGDVGDNRAAIFCLENNKWYLWISDSSESDDGDLYLKPTAFTSEDGRWRQQ